MACHLCLRICSNCVQEAWTNDCAALLLIPVPAPAQVPGSRDCSALHHPRFTHKTWLIWILALHLGLILLQIHTEKSLAEV